MERLNTVLNEVAVNGNVRFEVFETDELRNTPTSTLNVSNRSRNAFLRNGIDNIGKLIDNWDGLGKMRSLGKKSINEIKYSLCSYQYSILTKEKQNEYLMNLVKLNTGDVA